jgi:hypothetical protein
MEISAKFLIEVKVIENVWMQLLYIYIIIIFFHTQKKHTFGNQVTNQKVQFDSVIVS